MLKQLNYTAETLTTYSFISKLSQSLCVLGSIYKSHPKDSFGINYLFRSPFISSNFFEKIVTYSTRDMIIF